MNDTMRIEWTDVSSKPEYVTGMDALRIPDHSNPRYRLFRPLRYGWVNEAEYDSARSLWEDIRIIILEATKAQLGIQPGDLGQYSCVIAVPDYYERVYVTTLLDMAITDFKFAKVSFIQESLAASFGCGLMTACIVDIGHQKTSISCVEDGMIVENSRVNLKMGGEDITNLFVKMMIYNHFPYAEINLKRRHDYLLAEELKQKLLTMTEADISVSMYDFHLRAPDQETRKYTCKIYDEVILPVLSLLKPEMFDMVSKLQDRHKLIDRSYDIYDGKPNDPTSTAQAEILTQIAPEDILSSTKPKINGALTNGHVNGDDGSNSRRPSVSHLPNLNGDAGETTPQASHASSPVRQLDNTGTPQPEDAGTPIPFSNDTLAVKPKEEEEPEEPLSIERRDDILPIYSLAHAITTSINHAARQSGQRTRDFLGSITLIGGASMTPGLATYLEEILQGTMSAYQRDINVGKPPRELDAQVVVWKGGAVFGRMSRTNDSWVNPFLYERLGERVLSHKLMWAW
jgi:actin-related protein 8